MNVLTIQIGKKKWPVKYGFQALVDVQELLPGDEDLSLSAMSKMSEIPTKKLPDFVLAGIKNGCDVMGKDELPTREDIISAMNRDFQAVYLRAMEIFTADMSNGEEPKEENSQAEQEPVSSVAGEAGQSGN